MSILILKLLLIGSIVWQSAFVLGLDYQICQVPFFYFIPKKEKEISQKIIASEYLNSESESVNEIYSLANTFNSTEPNATINFSKDKLRNKEPASIDTNGVRNLGIAINSPYADYFPSISHDDATLIFTQRFKNMEEEFYIAYKDSCGDWETAYNMGHPPNSNKNESSQTMSLDRKYLFFTRCGIVSDNGWAEGGCDIYFSHPSQGKWVAPVPFGATINTPAYEGMPSICPENKILYFASNREGGYGGYDIWSVSFYEGQWQLPVNLGPEVNTKYDDIAPFIASDNLTLYCSSNRKGGIGGMDIYRAARSHADSAWSGIAALPIPINSPQDDISAHLLSSGDKLYFSSNRPGGYGDFDIYEATVPKSFQPEARSLIAGYTVDADQGDTIKNVSIIISQGEKKITELHSNKGDGSFYIALAPNQEYTIKAKRFDYPEITFEYRINVHQTATPIELIIPLEYYTKRMKDISQENNADSTTIESTDTMHQE